MKKIKTGIRLGKIKICPNCKKAGIGMFIGMETGNYQCSKCGYIGPIIVEIEKKSKSPKRIRKKRK